jgi:hypothetical protein
MLTLPTTSYAMPIASRPSLRLRFLRSLRAVGTIAALLALAGDAAAQAADAASPAPAAAGPSAAQKETARAWLREGYELLEQKQFAPALERFSAAYRLVRVPTTGLAVAQAQASLGQWVEANATAMEVINMPSQPGEPEVFGRARDDARALLDRLHGAVPSVSVDVAPREARAQVSIDGAAMPAVEAMSIKLNPGEHRLLVTAAGYAPHESVFRLAAGDNQQLSVTLVVGDDMGLAAAPLESSAGISAESSAPAPPPAAEADAGSGARTRGLIALGVGGVAALTGSVTGILAFSSKPDCPNDLCTLDQKDDADASKTYGTIATVSFGVAVVAGAYGLWELLANAPSEPPPALARTTVIPTRSGALLQISGAF